jgi:hypothetical protein
MKTHDWTFNIKPTEPLFISGREYRILKLKKAGRKWKVKAAGK